MLYTSLTVHPRIILVNNQHDAIFSRYLFISLLYMFRATQCSSLEESNCINTSSAMCHSVQNKTLISMSNSFPSPLNTPVLTLS